jgi:hypothetical protein
VIPESEIHRALGPGFGWPLGVSLERLHWHSRSVRFEQLVQSPFQKLRAHGRVPASSAVSERNRLWGMSREARQAVPCLPDEGGHQSVNQNEVHQTRNRKRWSAEHAARLFEAVPSGAVLASSPRLLDLEARRSTISGMWYSRPHGRPSARAVPLVPSELHAETIDDANH